MNMTKTHIYRGMSNGLRIKSRIITGIQQVKKRNVYMSEGKPA